MRGMSRLAKKERRCDHMWGVVNPGNALCAGVFRTRALARQFQKDHASAYVVVRVVVMPEYDDMPFDGVDDGQPVCDDHSFPEERTPNGTLLLGQCLNCGLSAADAIIALKTELRFGKR